MRILIDLYHKDYELWRYPLELFSELKEEFPSVEFSYIKNKNKYLESLPHADAIIGWRLREVDFPHAEKLRWYHTMAAGIGSMFYKSFIESDIILTNSAGVRAAPMADCIMAYIITFARRFLLLANAQRKKLWVRYEYWREIHKVIDLDSAVVGIIGLGGIGREVAKRSKACGMKVLGVKRNVDIQIDNVDAVYPPEKLHDVLAESDFVVVAVPHTPDTDKLIGYNEFNVMKDTTIIINVGRGKLIDTDALIDALVNGKIGGAALDVVDPEPPPEDSPLWNMDNVIITPHITGIGPGFWDRSQDLLRHNIKAFIEGTEFLNVVDKNLQY